MVFVVVSSLVLLMLSLRVGRSLFLSKSGTGGFKDGAEFVMTLLTTLPGRLVGVSVCIQWCFF